MPTDVAIVGGGIIGGSIAWRLAQAGLEVAVYDAGTFGGEASSAGAGMLAPGAEIEEGGIWAELAMESLAEYPAFTAGLTAETGVAIDYQQCGATELASDDQEWHLLQERAVRQRALGIASEERGRSLFYPDDAVVDPRHVMKALRAALLSHAAVLHEHTPVRELNATSEGVEVISARGSERAAVAVLAAGAWSSALTVTCGGQPEALPAAVPVKGHLVGWHRAPGTLGPVLRQGHTYLLQRSSGMIIAGSSSERVGFDRSVDARIVADLAQRARLLLPGVLEEKPAEAWIGFRPGTVSGLPVIRRCGDSRLWLAYGHYRNGILIAPATARRIHGEIISSLGSG